MNLFFVIAAFLCVFYACENQRSPAIFEINLESAVGTNSEIKCSNFITSIEYIPLETSDKCLISNPQNIYIIEDNLVVLTRKECFIFDKYTGDFKHQVAQQGRGPGEYNNVLGLIDPVNKTVFFQRSGGEVLEYSLQNTLVNQVSIPSYNSVFKNSLYPIVFTIYKNWLLCYFSNFTGIQEKLIEGINKKTGKSDFIIPNTNIYNGRSNQITLVCLNDALFYSFSNQYFFKDFYNDTIYNLRDSVLEPHGIIHTGKYHYPYDQRWDRKKDPEKLIIPRNIIESNKFFYFEYLLNLELYFGLYSKKDDKLAISPNNEGIPNDIDDFINFSPKTANSDNTVIGIIDAYKILEWFSNNPGKAANLPDKLKKLKSIDENDNPVVMIAKLKE